MKSTIQRKAIIFFGNAAALLCGILILGCIEGTTNDITEKQNTVNDDVKVYDKGYRLSSTQYDGIDLLIVIDNSASMGEEQQILSSDFFPLINQLTRPIQGDPGWSFPPVENLKVAVVTSDLGLQYGDAGSTAMSPTTTQTCEDVDGDDGRLMSTPQDVGYVFVADDFIECDPLGDQCPLGFECTENGYCDSVLGDGMIACGDHYTKTATTTAAAPNSAMAAEAACMASQGVDGCGFEQPLEAGLRGVTGNEGFIEENHVLAVIVVSDEEDCSIEDPALFNTPEWLGMGDFKALINTACNINDTNSGYLFDTARYKEKLTALKGGLDEAVVFSAIVGVPPASEGDEVVCEGSGAETAESGCLDRDDMQLTVMEFEDYSTGGPIPYTHFAPACTRSDAKSGEVVTEARPGRRFVEVAEDFGANGFVSSICNADWGPALLRTGEAVAAKLTHPCFPTQAPWTKLESGNCPDCGTVSEGCDLFIEYKAVDDDFACPSALLADLDDDEKEAALAKTLTETADGITDVYCAVPKVAAPLSCAELAEMEGLTDEIGWTYCEDDGVCDYSVDATPAVRDIAAGHLFAYRCAE